MSDSTPESPNSFVRITRRVLLVLIILSVGGVAIMVAVLVRGAEWIGHYYSDWRSGAAALTFDNPFKKFPWISGVAPGNTVVEPLRVVSEESQVVDVVKHSSDAVVSIIASAEVPKVERCGNNSQQMPGVPADLQDFFNTPTLCQNGTELQRVGAGSGFIVSADGYIITNKHVVADEHGEYTVVLNDAAHAGQKVKADVLARDPNNDVAILKINLAGLPYLTFGDSSRLQVGQTAIAIGYALGQFDNTVSKGVISGLARSVSAEDGDSSEELRGLIQTDAAINPGNSGGPLLDLGGNVIGMNVAMADAQSIGFAIPINAVKADYNQVLAGGQIAVVARAFLGVRYTPITPELQANNKLPVDHGMLVTRGPNSGDVAVVPGSPAYQAGIVENDVILSINGQALNDNNLLSDALANFKPGDVVTLQVYHKGETRSVQVSLGKK